MTKPTWWSITASKRFWTFESIKAILERECERFVIGEEVGEGGYEHFQIKAVFKKGRDTKELGIILPGTHVTPTSVKNFQYEEKEGNFYRSWEGALKEYQNYKPLPWQQQALDVLEKQTDREICVIIDEEGGHGKTTLAKMMQVNRIAQYCPQMESASDYMAFAMAKPSKGYCFDMPRSEDIKKRKSLWSAMEQIKNGYLYDKRYNYRDMWIEPPKMVVMANEEPPYEALSKDRWKVFYIEDWGNENFLVWHENKM